MARSDVLLLLCTEGVLTRPWVLLELYEAYTRGVPVVCVLIARKGFPPRDNNRRFLAELEVQLEESNRHHHRANARPTYSPTAAGGC